MKNMLKILYGNLTITKNTDYIIVPLKYLYIIFSIPFLVFSFLLMARSLGAFGSPKNEKFGIVKKILLHFADVFWSTVIWQFIIIAIRGDFQSKIK